VRGASVRRQTGTHIFTAAVQRGVPWTGFGRERGRAADMSGCTRAGAVFLSRLVRRGKVKPPEEHPAAAWGGRGGTWVAPDSPQHHCPLPRHAGLQPVQCSGWHLLPLSHGWLKFCFLERVCLFFPFLLLCLFLLSWLCKKKNNKPPQSNNNNVRCSEDCPNEPGSMQPGLIFNLDLLHLDCGPEFPIRKAASSLACMGTDSERYRAFP